MHSIKSIRKDPELFFKKLDHRNSKIDSKNLLNLDKENRDLIQKKKNLNKKRKLFQRIKIKTNSQGQKQYQVKLSNSRNLK